MHAAAAWQVTQGEQTWESRNALLCCAVPRAHDAALGASTFIQGADLELSVLATTEKCLGGVNNKEQKLIENPDNAEDQQSSKNIL